MSALSQNSDQTALNKAFARQFLSHRKWTASKASRGYRSRARLLVELRVLDGPMQLQEIQILLGLPSAAAASYHVAGLVAAGLVKRRDNGYYLTEAGGHVADLLVAYSQPESVLEKLVVETCGYYCPRFSGILGDVAARMDDHYSKTRSGLRRMLADGRFEDERKATAKAILEALRTRFSLRTAAARVGIHPAALRERIARIFSEARLAWEPTKKPEVRNEE